MGRTTSYQKNTFLLHDLKFTNKWTALDVGHIFRIRESTLAVHTLITLSSELWSWRQCTVHLLFLVLKFPVIFMAHYVNERTKLQFSKETHHQKCDAKVSWLRNFLFLTSYLTWLIQSDISELFEVTKKSKAIFSPTKCASLAHI